MEKTSFTRNEMVKFGTYLLSQQRKRRFSQTTRQNKKDGISSIGTRARLALVHHADVENFIHDLETNPNIQYTESSECILKGMKASKEEN